MDWIFERVIELAAWVALIMSVIFFCDALWLLFLWVRSFGEENSQLLVQAGQAAGAFVLSSLSMGLLACIDRYVFDLPEDPAS